MKTYKWILGVGSIAITLITPTAWAAMDTSGYQFSVYSGWQKQTIQPGSFTLIGDEEERLVPHPSTSTAFNWGLGAGYRFLISNPQNIFRFAHDVTVGLDVFYFQANQSGVAFDYNESPDFNYRATIQSVRLLGNVEWTFLPIISKTIYPFVEIGAGFASNTNHYSDTPNAQSPDGVGITFSRYATIQFAYDAGMGLKWMPSSHVAFSLRYLFSNVGSVLSGTKASLPLESGYDFHLHTQSLLLGLSYLF